MVQFTVKESRNGSYVILDYELPTKSPQELKPTHNLARTKARVMRGFLFHLKIFR